MKTQIIDINTEKVLKQTSELIPFFKEMGVIIGNQAYKVNNVVYYWDKELMGVIVEPI